MHGRGEKIAVRAWKPLPPGLMPIHDDASGVGVGTEDFFGTPSNSFFFFLQHGNNLSGVRVIIYVGTKGGENYGTNRSRSNSNQGYF